MKNHIWTDCYTSHKWDKLRVKESIKHPAKMANGLLEKIFKYLMKRGLLKTGDTVLDPMAGIGTTALGWCAMNPSNRAITVELEEKYIQMQNANKRHAEKILCRKINWTIIKGDARNLSKILGINDVVGIVSPPYTGMMTKPGGYNKDKMPGGMKNRKRQDWEYSKDPKNIGNLPDCDICLMSPPYEDAREWKSKRYDKFIANARQRQKKGSMGGHYSTPEAALRYINKIKDGGPEHKDNIGKIRGEYYLEAMANVYGEIAKCCSTCVTVTKNPTRKGKLRRLDLDTKALLEISGYKIKTWIRARLFKIVKESTLDGRIKTILKGRISLFKRLQFKRGLPIADSEDIMIGLRE